MTETSWESPLSGVAPTFAHEHHPVWSEIQPKPGRGGFTRKEFDRPDEMDVEFLRLLYRVRVTAGVPMRITSDARDPDGDVGADKSAHKKRPCRAVDCWVHNSHERYRIVAAAALCGIRRIGVYPGQEGDRGSVHLDAETHRENPSPRMWTRY